MLKHDTNKARVGEQAYNTSTDPPHTLQATIIDEGFCERCSSLDIDEIFARQITHPSWSSFVVDLGSYETLKRSPCQLCRLLAKFAKYPLITGSCHLRVFSATEVFTGSNKICSEDLRDTNVIGVLSSEIPSAEELEYSNLLFRDVLLETGYLSLESPMDPGDMCRIRTLDANTFDISLAKHWLSYCDQNHQATCASKTTSKLQNLKVIDCHNLRVVNAPEGCRYTALSYVWGKPTSSAVSAKNSDGLENRFEKVVQDSITATLQLGLSHLWVDKVCINQSDEADKRHQIRQMDLIYEKSVVTIIAAAGDDPSHGLPGINGTPRKPQERFTIRERTLVSTLPHGRYAAGKSKWSTRGWTYQEYMLSTRRLIFTETQVFFECKSMNCREVLDLDLDRIDRLDNGKSTFWARSWGAIQADFFTDYLTDLESKYMGIVTDYTSRELTYGEDRLKAFQGVLGALKREEPPIYNFWAIVFRINKNPRSRSLDPFQFLAIPGSSVPSHSSSVSRNFARGLFWRSATQPDGRRNALKRRYTEFPSWSWLAWDGTFARELAWDVASGKMHPYATPEACVWLLDHRGNTCILDELDFEPNMPDIHDIYTCTIEVEAWVISVNIVETRAELELQDRIYVRFTNSNGQEMYSKLECNDPERAYPKDHTYIGFLPWEYGIADAHEYVILLEDVGGFYERVGLFKVGVYWRVDENEEMSSFLKHRGKGYDKFTELNSTRRKFRLG